MQIADILIRHKDREGPLLPILHDVQAEFGFIGENVIRTIGGALFLLGSLIMVYNIYRTIRGAEPVTQPVGMISAPA